jgi:CheY-like chemotaxis protein
MAGLTVLVVDDYADTRELIRTLLEGKGCHVVEAASGQEAVNVAARIAFSFILNKKLIGFLDMHEQ